MSLWWAEFSEKCISGTRVTFDHVFLDPTCIKYIHFRAQFKAIVYLSSEIRAIF